MSLVMCKDCGRWVSFLYVEDCQHCYDVLFGRYWSNRNKDVYWILTRR